MLFIFYICWTLSVLLWPWHGESAVFTEVCQTVTNVVWLCLPSGLCDDGQKPRFLFFHWAAVLRRWRAGVLLITNTPQDKLGQYKHVRLIMFACVWKCKPKINLSVSSWSALFCFLGCKLFLCGHTSAEPPSLCLKLDRCHLPPFPLSLCGFSGALSAILSPRGAQKWHVATGCICEPVTLWASSQAASLSRV